MGLSPLFSHLELSSRYRSGVLLVIPHRVPRQPPMVVIKFAAWGAALAKPEGLRLVAGAKSFLAWRHFKVSVTECAGATRLMARAANANLFSDSPWWFDVKKNYMVPRGGIEPPTRRFSVFCSPTELPRHECTSMLHVWHQGVNINQEVCWEYSWCLIRRRILFVRREGFITAEFCKSEEIT